MSLTPDVIPPNYGNLQGDDVGYGVDTPFNVKQAVLTHRRHRWFDPRPLGANAGPGNFTSPLPAGALMRVAFDNRPDWIVISISGQTAATGRVLVTLGEEGGNGFVMGPHGYATLPCPHDGVISIRNIGTTATTGVVLAVAGYSDPGVTINCGD